MPKFICCADTHYRKKNPRSRLDNFFQSQVKKTKWILELCKKKDAVLLIAGDIFDSSKPSFEVISTYINLFKKCNFNIYTIYGNHDLTNHRLSSSSSTGLGILVSAGVVTPLSTTPIHYKGIDIYGANWIETIPVIQDKNNYNICLIHDMIVSDTKQYMGSEKTIEGNKLIKKENYNLIVSGHNHQSFVCENNNKFLCNPGSISRINTTQLDFQPRIGLIDTDIQSFSWIDIPVHESAEVFDLNNIETDKQTEIDVNNFIEALKNKGIGPKYEKRHYETEINIYLKENKFSDEIVDLIYSAMSNQ